jgi:hypothetical protein
VDDDALLALAKNVLDQHFGIYYGSQGITLCATCDKVSWPCPPARLAEVTREQVLAR